MKPRTLKLNAHRSLVYYTPEDVAEILADAERGRWMVKHGEWHRHDGGVTHIAVEVPPFSDLSCVASRRAAIDSAMKASKS